VNLVWRGIAEYRQNALGGQLKTGQRVDFKLTLYGRIWVTPKENAHLSCCKAAAFGLHSYLLLRPSWHTLARDKSYN